MSQLTFGTIPGGHYKYARHITKEINSEMLRNSLVSSLWSDSRVHTSDLRPALPRTKRVGWVSHGSGEETPKKAADEGDGHVTRMLLLT